MQFHAEATMHETLLGNSLHWDFLSQSNVFSPPSDAHYVTVACGEGSSRPCSSWLGRLKTTQGAFTTARVLREVMSRPRLGVGRTEEADRKITPVLPNRLLMKGSVCSEFPPFFFWSGLIKGRRGEKGISCQVMSRAVFLMRGRYLLTCNGVVFLPFPYMCVCRKQKLLEIIIYI